MIDEVRGDSEGEDSMDDEGGVEAEVDMTLQSADGGHEAEKKRWSGERWRFVRHAVSIIIFNCRSAART